MSRDAVSQPYPCSPERELAGANPTFWSAAADGYDGMELGGLSRNLFTSPANDGGQREMGVVIDFGEL